MFKLKNLEKYIEIKQTYMTKEKILSIHERNRITDNIINAFIKRKNFLLCGHKSPDEDCISSMIAFAILLTKFDKIASIYIDGTVPQNITYLLNICKYNSIKIIKKNNNISKGIDTIVICDTPKPAMLDVNKRIEKLFNIKNIIKIEFDHHIGSDSEYIGDKDYCLVDTATSTCELIGFLALKLKNNKEILKKHFILDPFSRNFILTLLTGIVADTNMGQYLKSRREKKYYEIFSKTYSDMLMKITVKESNFTKIDEVFSELKKLSDLENECYNFINGKKQFSKSVGYVILQKKDSKLLFDKYGEDIVVSVSRYTADKLAEESGKISLIVYFDNSKKSQLIQFRIRRKHNYKKFDLRNILSIFSILDGGGHEGAIAFRFPEKKIKDLTKYSIDLIQQLDKVLSKLK